jgi:predicted DNA-binding transcriptional regulator AlpA
MMSHTIEIIKTALKADNSVSASDRARVLATIRNGGSKSPETARFAEPRLIRRAEAAHRLGCSLRLIDRLAKDGALVKRKLPGRKRSAGFLEADVVALIT